MIKIILGYPFWPGQVVNPSGTGLSAKKGSVIVKFYGTNDYAPVKIDLLKERLLKCFFNGPNLEQILP